jgi:hypothetical protein
MRGALHAIFALTVLMAIISSSVIVGRTLQRIKSWEVVSKNLDLSY